MLDPDFPELFKVQADFEEAVDRSDETLVGMSILLRHYAEKEDLLPPADDALARLLDESTRIAGDSKKLSLRLPISSVRLNTMPGPIIVPRS